MPTGSGRHCARPVFRPAAAITGNGLANAAYPRDDENVAPLRRELLLHELVECLAAGAEAGVRHVHERLLDGVFERVHVLAGVPQVEVPAGHLEIDPIGEGAGEILVGLDFGRSVGRDGEAR